MKLNFSSILRTISARSNKTLRTISEPKDFNEIWSLMAMQGTNMCGEIALTQMFIYFLKGPFFPFPLESQCWCNVFKSLQSVGTRFIQCLFRWRSFSTLWPEFEIGNRKKMKRAQDFLSSISEIEWKRKNSDNRVSALRRREKNKLFRFTKFN